MKNTLPDLDALNNECMENISVEERRNFLKMGLTLTGVFAGGTLFSAVSNVSKVYASEGAYAEKYPYKPHYSMLIRTDRCVDCEECLAECARTNDVPDYGYRTNILEREVSDAIGRKREFMPVLCNHCNLAQCTRVCPTKATYKDKQTGIVMMDKTKCIGCLTCQLGCPYNARYFNEQQHAVDKCNFCYDTRLSKGETETGCCAACAADCRNFGDLADPASVVYQNVHQLEKPIWVLRPEVGTKPNVFYTRG